MNKSRLLGAVCAGVYTFISLSANAGPLPADHNIDLSGTYHALGYDIPYTAECTECHGQALQGVAEIPSCYSCHGQLWSESEDPINIILYYTDAASAKDVGPKTGTFDVFLTPPGPVGDNGYEENRTALEFDISEIPTGSEIQTATLTLNYTLITDPVREISVYGYVGNGLVYDQSQIYNDFTAGVHIQDSNLALDQPDVEYDVTLFIQDLIDGGNSYAGFNLRESATTAGCCGLNVIFLLEGEFTQPVLKITYLEASPSKQIMILSNKVMELNTKKGISNAMDSKLKNAYEALDDSNQKNDGAAANTMQAFINSVDAQRGKEITDEEADYLNAAAREIIQNLNK